MVSQPCPPAGPGLFFDDDHRMVMVVMMPVVMMFPVFLVDCHRLDDLSLNRRNKNTQGEREQQEAKQLLHKVQLLYSTEKRG